MVSVSEVHVGQLLHIVWKQRQWVYMGVGLFLLLGVLYLHVAPDKYTVALQVVPVTNNSRAPGGALSSLGALAGVDMSSLSGSNSGGFAYYADGVRSRAASDLLARDQALLQAVFPEEWSDRSGWHQPFSIIRPVKNVLFRVLGIPVKPWSPPSGERLNDFVRDHLEVLTDSKSPVTTLQIQSDHPATMIRLLNRLNSVTDDMLRARALTRANQYIAYIDQQLKQVTVTEYRTALLQNLYDQEKMRMMASAHISYAADVFSGPTVSSKPTAPRAPIVLILAIIVGVIAGALAGLYAEARGLSLRGLRAR